MSFEQAFVELLQPLQEEIHSLRAEVQDLSRALREANRKPVYDANALKDELGFAHVEA